MKEETRDRSQYCLVSAIREMGSGLNTVRLTKISSIKSIAYDEFSV